jgi:hypothetical protein
MGSPGEACTGSSKWKRARIGNRAEKLAQNRAENQLKSGDPGEFTRIEIGRKWKEFQWKTLSLELGFL